ncbi:AAA family ATPase [Sorangium sp. So ce1151]|uniref:AAA family ATPase n=1 Tax=Sorangium sp. So ce1151 TaxID=3133332 RepID=UPI003F5FE300
MTPPRPSGARWRLTSITVRQFRGIAKEHRFEFNGRPGMLYGNNGVGKSTVALALQWILYGRFPVGVLPNATLDRFLSPVQAKRKQYSGEVVLGREREKLVISRDATMKELKVALGGEMWLGAEAEEKRDELLGLDMDSFVRAVLLQQSRIRAVLLDDPKERNKALDRLLGMDSVEHLLELLRPKDFTQAAEAWREKVRDEEQRFAERERLLGEQLEAVQNQARTLKFQNKDFNPTGLRTRCADLSRDLMALGNKYRVKVAELPTCTAPARVASFSEAFKKHLQGIRVGAQLREQLAPVEKDISTWTALREGWAELLALRNKIAAALAQLVEKVGEEQSLVQERGDLNAKQEEIRRALKAAGDTRQLLEDARALIVREKTNTCPVCEQSLPARLDIAVRLQERSTSLASEDITRLEARLAEAQTRAVTIDEALALLKSRKAELAACQEDLDKHRQKVVKALGGGGIVESKILVRLDEALMKREAESVTIGAGIRAMEQDLEEIELRHDAFREGLVPVVAKREEQAAHEDAAKKAKALHARDEARAEKMDGFAAQVDAIRKALLSAKQELAGESLRKAGPHAQLLYRALVRQPVFDTLEIQATPRANKVDYTFAVSAHGASATARDARLVLSDGQLTATALALFFALAESTAHKVELLYIDDPTQNLDLPCKEAMAKVIAELAQRRQVIVSTQDEDFVSFLDAAGFHRDAVVHHLKSWDGHPTVKTSPPT